MCSCSWLASSHLLCFISALPVFQNSSVWSVSYCPIVIFQNVQTPHFLFCLQDQSGLSLRVSSLCCSPMLNCVFRILRPPFSCLVLILLKHIFCLFLRTGKLEVNFKVLTYLIVPIYYLHTWSKLCLCIDFQIECSGFSEWCNCCPAVFYQSVLCLCLVYFCSFLLPIFPPYSSQYTYLFLLIALKLIYSS